MAYSINACLISRLIPQRDMGASSAWVDWPFGLAGSGPESENGVS
jgi:hypothetical protein